MARWSVPSNLITTQPFFFTKDLPMPELNPFQNLDLTRYGFGPEKQLVSPLLFKGLADLKPQPIENPATAVGAPSAPVGGLNPFDNIPDAPGSIPGYFSGASGTPYGTGDLANLNQFGQDESKAPTAGQFLNTVSGNKMAMAMLATLFPSVAVALKGADYLQNRGKEKTAAGRLPQTKPALTAQQEIDRATSAAAQQLAQQPLAQVQQARPAVQAPVLPPDLYGGPDAQPDYGGIDFSGYDISNAGGFTPF